MPANVSLTDEPGLAAEAEAFFGPRRYRRDGTPRLRPRGIGPAGTAAALELVGALRDRRDPLGRRLTVVVTIEEETGTLADVLVRPLSDRVPFSSAVAIGRLAITCTILRCGRSFARGRDGSFAWTLPTFRIRRGRAGSPSGIRVPKISTSSSKAEGAR